MDTPHAVNRPRAAEMIGRKPATLRAWAAQNPRRGPRPTKTGTAKQAHTIFEVGEITAWLADPVASKNQIATKALCPLIFSIICWIAHPSHAFRRRLNGS
jgi:hypothetical protein